MKKDKKCFRYCFKCGKREWVFQTNRARSCIECAQKVLIKHGARKTKAYRAWSHMKSRCYNLKSPDYKNYGGRGIKIYEVWHCFDKFFEYMGDCPPNKSLDRINNEGDYEPGNVRWASKLEQANNKRNIRLITYNNITQSVPEWSRTTGIKAKTIHKRLNYNWPIEKALTEPVRKK